MKSQLLLVLIVFFSFFEAEAQDKDTYFITNQKDSIPQKDGIDYLIELFKIKRTQESIRDKKVSFSFFPVDARNTNGDRLFVSSFNATFLLGDKSNTNNSTVYLIPYVSFSNQYGVQLYPTVWLKENSWNFVGEYFILNFPQSTWGLGGDSPKSNETIVGGKQIRFHQNILKGIMPNFAVGLGFQYDNHYEIEIDEAVKTNTNNPEINQSDGNTISSGLAIPIVFDSRKNTMNPKNGLYTSLTFRFNSPTFGSDHHWKSAFLDIRKYYSIPQTRSVLAFRSYYWSVLSGEAPYFDLPSTRTEPSTGMSSRGIEKNRYRSNAMLFGEGEYRFNITKNGFVGGVLFSNITSASEYSSQCFKYWKPAAGCGVRLKFNKYTKVNVALDFGVSKDYASVYLNIGEAF